MYMRKLSQTVITGHDKAVVETKAGKIRGAIVEGTYIFRGVKYADAERFHMPHDVAPWEGVKEALVYGYNAPELNTVLAHDEPYVPHYFWPENEHCQYVNIWTKSIDKNAKKPVMVWMHGGGWMGGSSVEIYSYDGENLADYGDVVVVSLNHRLNVLGYLDLSAYGEEYKDSVNAGLGDLVAALKWVHENIEAFGGDPSNVTIMGQSGGGAKVLSMLQTPSADGLFHKAVMQSGGASLGFNPDAKKEAMHFADLIVANLGLTKDTIKKIETVSWYDLSAATIKAIYQLRKEGKGANWGPIPDCDFYYGNPGQNGWRKESLNIPMIVGSNMGEFRCYNAFELEKSKNAMTDAEVDKMLADEFGDKKDAVTAAFKKAYPDHNIIDSLYVDISMRPNLVKFVESRAKNATAPVWEYMFSFESDWDGGVPAWHNAEEPFMFHNARYVESAFVPEESDKLEDAMSTAWLSLAKNADPNNTLIPEWKPVTPDQNNIMIFDRNLRTGVDFDKELMDTIPAPKPGGFPGSDKMFSVYGADLEV